MWPSVGVSGPLVRSTTVPPMRFTTSVTSGPVTWFGVGWVICTRTGVLGLFPDPDDPLPDDLPLPQPVSVTVSARRTGSTRRVTLALIVDTFLHGRNSRTATTPLMAAVLMASALV